MVYTQLKKAVRSLRYIPPLMHGLHHFELLIVMYRMLMLLKTSCASSVYVSFM